MGRWPRRLIAHAFSGVRIGALSITADRINVPDNRIVVVGLRFNF